MDKNNNTIQTYDDLVEEKKRLEAMLIVHRDRVSTNWVELKKEFEPVNNVIGFFSKLTTRDKSNPIVNMGIDVAGDLLLRKILLARAGWATRLVVPFLLKNYSSNIFADKGKSFLQRIKYWFQAGKNGQPDPVHNEFE